MRLTLPRAMCGVALESQGCCAYASKSQASRLCLARAFDSHISNGHDRVVAAHDKLCIPHVGGRAGHRQVNGLWHYTEIGMFNEILFLDCAATCQLHSPPPAEPSSLTICKQTAFLHSCWPRPAHVNCASVLVFHTASKHTNILSKC